jgi:hypothetical protein
MNEGKIPCHTCGAKVKLVRSVKLRQWQEFDPAYANDHERYMQYVRNMTFRRAFICPACYGKLDNRFGSGQIQRDGLALTFGLAGESRGDKAATYDHAKWLAHQRKLAAEFGVDVPE